MNAHATHSTRPYRGQTDDWITPESILDALGPFDLDPCACEPQPWPTARTMWTRADDGLSKPWHGRVWLNPPYGPNAERWVERLAAHRRGTALLFARTETVWFISHVWRRATALLFLHGRLHFHKPDGTRARGNAGGPSVLVAYGDYDAEVLLACRLDGTFVRPVWRMPL